MATKIWGPMGWMTLHSISVIYPESPTTAERLLITKWFGLFADTITCVHCKNHFTAMFKVYTNAHPNWNASRQELFVFVCRAHNTVNRRLDKPQQRSVSDCLTSLKNATTQTSPAEYRNAYISYLIRNWTHEFGGDARIFLGHAKEMQKIEQEYWSLRDKGYDVILDEANVSETIPEDSRRYTPSAYIPSRTGEVLSGGFKGGRLKFGRH